MTHQISIFISHSWSYSGHYNKLEEWIFQENWSFNNEPIEFFDLSVPKDNPIHNASNAEQLKNAIYARIQISDVVVIPTGMYSSHSKWIGKEIEGSLDYGKPILGVNPWSQERKAAVVQEVAKEVVGWSKESVINGIWRIR